MEDQSHDVIPTGDVIAPVDDVIVAPSAGIPFWKYHGAGNDFVMLDNRHGQQLRMTGGRITPDLVRRFCDRRLGVGGDGLIVLEEWTGSSDDGYDFRMEYSNSDGTYGALCGNGARCAVAFAVDRGVRPTGGRHHFRFVDREQRILEGHMTGCPTTNGVTYIGVRMPDVDDVLVLAGTSGYLVDTGCPHLVVYVENEAALDAMDVSTSGSGLRHDVRFRATGGTNVNFVWAADDSDVIRVRTFERGVEAETLSCGTGAVAATVVDLYRKFVAPTEALHPSDGVTSCDVCERGDDVANSINGVADSAMSRKCDVIPTGDVMRMCVARDGDVISAEGNATLVVDGDRAVQCNRGTGSEGCYVRHVESKGGRLTVRVDCHVDRSTGGGLVFRNILLSGPTTKVFSGRFF